VNEQALIRMKRSELLPTLLWRGALALQHEARALVRHSVRA